MIPRSRILENIVPKEHRKTFSLYQEEEPNFSFSSSPKQGEQNTDPSMDAAPAEPLAASPAPVDAPPPEGDDKTKNQSAWLVKKLVGLLRYGGAMAVELRGAVPDEANEIIEQLQDQLEKIAASLDPFITNKTEEEPVEQEQPEGEATEEPEAPSTELEAPTAPAFKKKGA